MIIFPKLSAHTLGVPSDLKHLLINKMDANPIHVKFCQMLPVTKKKSAVIDLTAAPKVKKLQY